MGCTSSQVNPHNKLIINKKPAVWLIGGGPGANKGKICERLVTQYKFKYLSSYDMVQFQQDRGGPDAQEIIKAFKEGSKLSSQVKVRLVKKAIASCGIRRFIIDGFPNNIQDIQEFDRQLTSREIDFHGYIQIMISSQIMKKSGLKAHQNDKGDKAQIEQKINETINQYLIESKKIRQEYEKKRKYLPINGNQGPDIAYSQLQNILDSQNIQPPEPVKVFFAHFDDPQHEFKLSDDLVRKYGLYYYTPAGLINEARYKSNSAESAILAKLQIENKQVPSELVLDLIRKKIEKHDYDGNFLISGYPRNIDDAKEWDNKFGWQTNILGYLSFEIKDAQFKELFIQRQKKRNSSIKPQQIDQKFKNYQANQEEICQYYSQKQLLLKIYAEREQQALKNIHNFFQSKRFTARSSLLMNKLLFLSTLTGPELSLQNHPKILMRDLYEKQIRSNGLYSQLIESYQKINKPIPGIVATKILLNFIVGNYSDGKTGILVQGFPDSAEQLQSWEEQVGQSIPLAGVVYYQYDEKYVEHEVKEKMANNKIVSGQKDAISLTKRYSQSLHEKVSNSDWKHLEISNKDAQKETHFEAFAKQVDFKQ